MNESYAEELRLWPGHQLRWTEMATMASPSWWGADSERWIVHPADDEDAVGQESVVVKRYTGAAKSYIDLDASITAAVLAGEHGIGPRVIHSSIDEGMLAMEDLSSSARCASLNDLDDGDKLRSIVAAHAAVHNMTGINRRSSVFDEMDLLTNLVDPDSPALPRDWAWMRRAVDDARTVLSTGQLDERPCHGDGNLSNALVGSDGRVRLCDWDSACLMDPMQDLGSLLLESGMREPMGPRIFELYWGSWNDRLYMRAQLYGVVEAIYRGLVGVLCDQEAPGAQEYSKFADWQFVFARMLINQSRFGDCLHVVGGGDS